VLRALGAVPFPFSADTAQGTNKLILRFLQLPPTRVHLSDCLFALSFRVIARVVAQHPSVFSSRELVTLFDEHATAQLRRYTTVAHPSYHVALVRNQRDRLRPPSAGRVRSLTHAPLSPVTATVLTGDGKMPDSSTPRASSDDTKQSEPASTEAGTAATGAQPSGKDQLSVPGHAASSSTAGGSSSSTVLANMGLFAHAGAAQLDPITKVDDARRDTVHLITQAIALAVLCATAEESLKERACTQLQSKLVHKSVQ